MREIVRREDPGPLAPAPRPDQRGLLQTHELPTLRIYSDRGSTPTVAALDEFVNHGNATRLTNLVQDSRVRSNAPIMVLVQDTSSSMMTIAAPVAAAEDRLKRNFQGMEAQVPDAKVWQFQISGKFCVITDIPVSVGGYEQLTPRDFNLVDRGGRLHGGSRLSDGLYAAAKVAALHRDSGHTGPIGLMLTTDGWNRLGQLAPDDSWDPKSCERASGMLAEARSKQVRIKLCGYVQVEDYDRLMKFCQRVGLRPEEVEVHTFDPRNAASKERSVGAIAEAQTMFSEHTITGRRPR